MKKIIIGYLIVSSIILHIIGAITAIWIVPSFIEASKIGKEWAQSSETSGRAIIKDISSLTEGEYKYKGYAIEYKGGLQYIMGSPRDNYSIGDEIKVFISKHPYGPLKSLMIVIQP